MSDFVFEEQSLPEDCEIPSIEPYKGFLWCEFESNPFISSERQFLDCFAEDFLHDKALVAATRSALYSVYMGKDEIGIFGLEFDSETSARQAATLLRQEFIASPYHAYYAIFQKMQMVIFLWRDDKTDNCFDELRELIEARLR